MNVTNLSVEIYFTLGINILNKLRKNDEANELGKVIKFLQSKDRNDAPSDDVLHKVSECLHIFFKNNLASLIRDIISIPGINLNFKDKFGKTPAQYAEELPECLCDKKSILEKLNPFKFEVRQFDDSSTQHDTVVDDVNISSDQLRARLLDLNLPKNVILWEIEEASSNKTLPVTIKLRRIERDDSTTTNKKREAAPEEKHEDNSTTTNKKHKAETEEDLEGYNLLTQPDTAVDDVNIIGKDESDS